MPAREFPAESPERKKCAPDDRVIVLIKPEDAKLGHVASLQQLMDIIGETGRHVV